MEHYRAMMFFNNFKRGLSRKQRCEEIKSGT